MKTGRTADLLMVAREGKTHILCSRSTFRRLTGNMHYWQNPSPSAIRARFSVFFVFQVPAFKRDLEQD